MAFNITTNYTTGETLVGIVMDGNTQIGTDYTLTESTAESGYYYSGVIDTSTYGTGNYAVLIKNFSTGNILGGDSQEFVSNVTREDYDKTQGDAIEADTDELQTNQGDFATATGFATPTDVSNAQTAIISEVDANETKIDTLTTNVNNLNDISEAEVNAQVDQALSDYDAPTKSELDSAFTEIKGAGWTSETLKDIRDNLGTGGTTPADVYNYFVASNREDVFKADISALALEATVNALNDLSSADVTAAVPTVNEIAVAVEAALINEGDGQQLIDAILQVINSNLDLPALELVAIAEAVRTELTTELNRIDANISSRSDFDHTTDEVITDAASRTASQADVSSIETKAEADARQAALIAEHNQTQTDISNISGFDPLTDEVIVGTNNDKTGYCIEQTCFDANMNAYPNKGLYQGTIVIATDNISEADVVINETKVITGNCKKGILKQKFGEPRPLTFNIKNWLAENSKLSSDIEYVNFVAKYNRKDADENSVLNLNLSDSITIDTAQDMINIVFETSDYTNLKLGKTYEIGLAIQFTGEPRPYELNLNNDRLQIIEDTIRANQLS
ncbi:MAG: hypothetical protein HRU18_27665 [Pseudoalteromonas sp.]|uniref:hypothetical protein n=1 Tax=Pseudoalteromonas sp. TaxID=53249 RepID=UPI001DA412CD|nr:hypothetical protein [Pseudoalteromonas sp.]NRA81991.1 hypothetical protein [Pseudoalteromonas sp.]